jgi:hypothetical protein
MFDNQLQNLPELVQNAEVLANGSATVAGPELHVRRAEHFASCVQFSLDEPEAMRRLHQATRKLSDASDLAELLPAVLEGAMALTGADFGNVQVFDVTGALTIATHSGFSTEFLQYFAVVDDDHSACGRAAGTGAQVAISDVDTDPGFAPHRAIAAASGFRAVQSTPLVDYSGRMIGMVSTHFRRPCSLPDRDLRVMEYYGDFAGEALAGRLGTVPAQDDDSIGRAVVAALLDPRQEWPAGPAVPYVLGNTLTDHELGSLRQSPTLELLISEFAQHIVNRLFSAGIGLESARSIAGDGAAGDRIAAAVAELDETIRDIRTTVFSIRKA